jgi:nitrite reductase (NADH) small subunit
VKANRVIDEFVTVASVDEIPSGTAKSVIVRSQEIAIFHVDDEWYAIEGTCPHQGGPLAEGWVHEKTVTCPWHAWCFSLETGRLQLLETTGVATFELRVEDGTVAVNPEPRGMNLT